MIKRLGSGPWAREGPWARGARGPVQARGGPCARGPVGPVGPVGLVGVGGTNPEVSQAIPSCCFNILLLFCFLLAFMSRDGQTVFVDGMFLCCSSVEA